MIDRSATGSPGLHGGVALVAGDTLEQQVQLPLLERGQRQVVDHEVMPEAMEVDLDSCQPALGWHVC